MNEIESARLLIIDDEVDLTSLLQHIFRQHGIFTDVFNDPLLALDALAQKDYCAVMSDINMPSMTGLELLRKIRALGHDLPFIFLTAHGSDPLKIREALQLGATDYLSKPFKSSELVDVVVRAIEAGRRLHRVKTEEDPDKRVKDIKNIQRLRIPKKANTF